MPIESVEYTNVNENVNRMKFDAIDLGSFTIFWIIFYGQILFYTLA